MNFNIDSVGSELPKDKPRISETGTVPVPEHEKEKLLESIREFAKREYDEDLDNSAFDNPAYIGIAETNVEDREDIVIDVAVNQLYMMGVQSVVKS